LKTLVASAAAIIAAAITVTSAPIGDVVASPLPKPAVDAITAFSVPGSTSIVSAPNSATRTFV
jgi:hypothetical protein